MGPAAGVPDTGGAGVGLGLGSGFVSAMYLAPLRHRRSHRRISTARRPGRRETTRSVAAEALFLPRVSVVVVAVALPEAADVVVQEFQPADPLRALPEVPLRHHEAERVAVVWLQRLALVAVRQQDVRVVEDLERHVRGVALLGVYEDVGRLGADLGHLQDRPDRDALPRGIQL